ncbi:10686_t:CDS:1, partial [Cetraspora pellucida]
QEVAENDFAELALNQEQTTELEDNSVVNNTNAKAKLLTDNELMEDTDLINS